MSRNTTLTDPTTIPGVRRAADYPQRPAVDRPQTARTNRNPVNPTKSHPSCLNSEIGTAGNWGYIPDRTRADDLGDFWDGRARVDATAPTAPNLFRNASVGLYEYRTWYREPGKVDLIQAAFELLYTPKQDNPVNPDQSQKSCLKSGPALQFLVWFDRDINQFCVYASDGMWQWATTALSALLSNINDDQKAQIVGCKGARR